MSKFKCPICGCPQINTSPRDETGAPSYEICPCCGGEFGIDDISSGTIEEYRKSWLESGANWFDPVLRPDDWDLRDQLLKIGFDPNKA